MAAYTAMRLAKATGNSRPAGKSARTTTMTRLAENRIAKKSGDEIPATAAATRETNARGSATLVSSNTQCRDFVTVSQIQAVSASRLALDQKRPTPYFLSLKD